ncbi:MULTISPECIES: 5'-methylthioadenosine/adenosylhomocysteine nucleosidase [Comamonadaceae]|uniref:5'-methylthioadenosine/adenosylhomocysteine nucleosidase n=1 Tax=Comamonadaceae TaxID=80864 RepID=UPI002720FF37|nr:MULTISPECIES: 5'-methylthioadenosine/adenosylhomocysteine nucleosidase [Comamonadaceae]MDO9144622.1 5'-methylthioadenosine/adenosylhomocysteine nucleosidase [Rhodoferax sp.]MDP1528340.1 5'-methylthioadenosine/adenosylhomocysteine nucleosidase [Rhodoferax sp.]MDP1945241.1 5'-methylthioadenosine/adenosylhomocysteine nucleosidase [Rhodoferax sp.]MDP2442970.1 5'-methylthioadenosine/adenosylhomocysteine nucleosidase [Rhodoferax sp.]MDP3883705.1 5'-methylthioadenosine/adenosylhomocysteine nucleos
MTLAIMSALLDEQRGLLERLDKPQRVKRAGRTFWCGQWAGQDVVLVLTKVGKVAAATTTTVLMEAFDVKSVLFTGVAGGVGCGVQVGDVVVADAFIQHDLNSAPLFPRYEIPLYGRATFDCDPRLSALLLEAAQRGLAGVGDHCHRDLPLASPQVHRGLIASGDQFVCDPVAAALMRADLQAAGHEPLAVEMEGAAVAQVCHDYGVPFAAMRTISDRADAQAHLDFSAFVTQVASPYALAVVSQFIQLRSGK